jgi:hypothetical protein
MIQRREGRRDRRAISTLWCACVAGAVFLEGCDGNWRSITLRAGDLKIFGIATVALPFAALLVFLSLRGIGGASAQLSRRAGGRVPMRLIVILSLVPVLTAVFVFRRVRRWCEREDRRRPSLIAVSIAILCLVAALVPGVFELRPPYSESPSGLIVILARGEALGILGMAAVATMVAAVIPSGRRGVGPAD